MVTTRSQTQGPMTRARARAAATNNKSTITKTKTKTRTKKASTPRKPTKKKNRTPAPRPRARRAAAVAAVVQDQQDVTPVAIVQGQQEPVVNSHDYVYTKMQTLAKSASAEHWTALRELIRRSDTFDQFHGTLMSLDAVVKHAAEGGQRAEERDVAFRNVAAEFFHE